MELIDAINEARHDEGLPPVKKDDRLTRMAQEWSMHCYEVFNAISHDNLGYRFWTALDRQCPGGECAAVNQKTAEDVVEFWLNTPSYRVTVLGDYDSVGIGRSGAFVVADFAKMEV